MDEEGFRQNKTMTFVIVAGGPSFEQLLLLQVHEIIEINHHQYNFTFYFMENTMISPKAKSVLKDLKEEFGDRFDYKLINYLWPAQLFYKPRFMRRINILQRVLFLDQMLPYSLRMTENHVILKDADQCLNINEPRWEKLFKLNMKDKLFSLPVHG